MVDCIHGAYCEQLKPLTWHDVANPRSVAATEVWNDGLADWALMNSIFKMVNHAFNVSIELQARQGQWSMNVRG